jgi:hypothetical protein
VPADGPSLDKVTLTGATVRNTGAPTDAGGAPSFATLQISIFEAFGPVPTDVEQFYGMSVDGNFSRGPLLLTLAGGDEVRVQGRGGFAGGGGDPDGSDPFSFDSSIGALAYLVPGAGSPVQNTVLPALQTTSSLLCTELIEGTVCPALLSDTLTLDIFITLRGGDSLRLPNSISGITSASEALVLAELAFEAQQAVDAQVPGPGALLLLGPAMAGLGWWRRRARS